MTDDTLALKQRAERNDDGDLVYEVNQDRGTVGKEINVTKLFQTPPRRSGDVQLLILEAEMAAGEDRTVENPAKPTGDVAKDAIEAIEDRDLEPAWRADE